jgi:hypothetical protein
LVTEKTLAFNLSKASDPYNIIERLFNLSLENPFEVINDRLIRIESLIIRNCFKPGRKNENKLILLRL